MMPPNKFRPSPSPRQSRRIPRGATRAIMPWDGNTRAPMEPSCQQSGGCRRSCGETDGWTAQPQPQRGRIFCFSRGRRASHRIRTAGQDQMKTAKKKKERGVPAGAGLQCTTAIAPSLFWDAPAASPIKARQSRSVPGGGPARIPDEPGSSTGIRGKVGLPVSGVARVWLLRGGTVRRDGPPPLGRALQNVVSFAPPIQPRPFEGRRGGHARLKAPSRTPPAILPLTERLFPDINAMTDTGLSWPTFLGIMNVSLPAWTAASMVGSGG